MVLGISCFIRELMSQDCPTHFVYFQKASRAEAAHDSAKQAHDTSSQALLSLRLPADKRIQASRPLRLLLIAAVLVVPDGIVGFEIKSHINHYC